MERVITISCLIYTSGASHRPSDGESRSVEGGILRQSNPSPVSVTANERDSENGGGLGGGIRQSLASIHHAFLSFRPSTGEENHTSKCESEYADFLSDISSPSLIPPRLSERRSKKIISAPKSEHAVVSAECFSSSFQADICIYPRFIPQPAAAIHRVSPLPHASSDLSTISSAFALVAQSLFPPTSTIARFVDVSRMILNGCGYELSESGGWVATDPQKSSNNDSEADKLCFPRTSSLNLEVPDPGSITECQRVELRCSEQYFAASHTISYPSTRADLCGTFSSDCIRNVGETCMELAGYASRNQFLDFKQIRIDTKRLAYETDTMVEMAKRMNIATPLDAYSLDRLKSGLARDCTLALLALVHHRTNGYSQGMYESCTYFRGYVGMSIESTLSVLDYLYSHVANNYFVARHRNTAYFRIMYTYLRTMIPEDIRRILDGLDQQIISSALTNFYCTLGARYLSASSHPDGHIRPHHVLPIWHFLFTHGRSGFLALFLGGIEMNRNWILKAAEDELAIANIIQNPLRRIFSSPDSLSPQDEEFNDRVQTVVLEYIQSASKILERDGGFLNFANRIDSVIIGVMRDTEYEIEVEDRSSPKPRWSIWME
jgi:hypothetical protein